MGSEAVLLSITQETNVWKCYFAPKLTDKAAGWYKSPIFKFQARGLGCHQADSKLIPDGPLTFGSALVYHYLPPGTYVPCTRDKQIHQFYYRWEFSRIHGAFWAGTEFSDSHLLIPAGAHTAAWLFAFTLRALLRHCGLCLLPAPSWDLRGIYHLPQPNTMPFPTGVPDKTDQILFRLFPTGD